MNKLSELTGVDEKGLEADSMDKDYKKGYRKRNRNSLALRDKIIDAAFECFSNQSYDNSSTRLIAKKAGVSHTSIIYHFESKENLWFEVIKKFIGGYIEDIEEKYIGYQESPGDSLRKFIHDFVFFSAKYPGVHRIMSMESTWGTERLDWLVNNYLKGHFKLVCDIIRWGQLEGSVRDEDPVRLYYLIIGAGAAPFGLAGEYRRLAGKDVFSQGEIYQSIAFLYNIVFRDS